MESDGNEIEEQEEFGPRKKRGRRPKDKYVPNEDHRLMVMCMSACQVPEIVQARVIGTTQKMLERHYKFEQEQGTAIMCSRVAQVLYEKALSPEISAPTINAATFILSKKGGWKEPEAAKDGADVRKIMAGKLNETETVQRMLSLMKNQQAIEIALENDETVN